MPITFADLISPRLRLARLPAIILPGALAFPLLVSLAMPPEGNVTLKALCILLCTGVSLASVALNLYILITRDEQAGLQEQRALAARKRRTLATAPRPLARARQPLPARQPTPHRTARVPQRAGR